MGLSITIGWAVVMMYCCHWRLCIKPSNSLEEIPGDNNGALLKKRSKRTPLMEQTAGGRAEEKETEN